MYAVIQTGSKQYCIKEGEIIDVEKMPGNVGEKVIFGDIVLLCKDGQLKADDFEGASVHGEIIDQVKDEKLVVFKYKKRKRCRRMKGHRQKLSRIKIVSICYC